MLLDGGSRADLGVVRSLGMAGIPVHLLSHTPGSITAASKYVRACHTVPGPGASDAERVARIVEIARSRGARPVLLVTGDRALSFLSRVRNELSRWIDHDLPPAEIIDLCLDKGAFAAVATKLGFPIPRTLVPRTIDDVAAMAERLTYPVFVKPRRPALGVVKLPGHGKGMMVESAETLLETYRALRRAWELPVVQEYVRGGDGEHVSVHVYLDADHQVVAAFTGHKLRVWPAHAGVGTHVVSQRADELIEQSRRVLRRLKYTGFAILQFKRDVVRDEYRLLEINCRYGTWTELPSRAGCNFPALAYAMMTGQTPPPMAQREAIAWLDFRRDFESLGEYRKSGEWTWGKYLKSLLAVRCWAFLAVDDLGPFFRQLVRSNAA